MKNLLFTILLLTLVGTAQVSTTTWNAFLTSYKADTTKRGVSQRKLEAEKATLVVVVGVLSSIGVIKIKLEVTKK